MSPAEHPRIGYVVKVYPRFSETFVVTEVLSREQAGEDLVLFAMRPTTDARFHPEIARVQAPVHHLHKPGKLAEEWQLLARALEEIPGFAGRYAALLPLLTRIDPPDVVQGVDLALRARDEGITHLHAHFGSLAARVACVASGLTGIPFSVTTHAKDLFHQDVDSDLLGEVLRRADLVVAISEFNRQFLRRRFPELDPQLVRNGLELARFEYADPAPVDGSLRVAGVGRLVEKKGFDRLLAAAALARRDGLDLQVRIAGDGELRAALAAQIEQFGLSGTVQLVGPRSQSEVRDLLRWADVLAAPCVVGADGNADGLPTVLLEAMAMGVPCLATAVTGIPEAIRPPADGDPGTGLLLPPGDVEALAAALRQAAAPDLPRVPMARAARALVEQEYDTAVQARRLAGLQIRGLVTAGAGR